MSSSPEDTLCPVCGDPFDFDVSSFPTEQDKRTSRLPLFSHKCIHNVCATCIVDWDSKGSNFNEWQRCPVCLALTSFNANVLPNGIDLKKCTLLRMVAQASATAGSTGIASTSAASSAMTSSATATATNNNEGDSASTDAFTDSRVTARAERNIRRNTVREIALANAAAARAARSARSASTTTMTTPDHGRDLDNKSAGSSIGLTAGSNIGLTSPTANVAPSNAMRTDSSAATDVSSGTDGSLFVSFSYHALFSLFGVDIFVTIFFMLLLLHKHQMLLQLLDSTDLLVICQPIPVPHVKFQPKLLPMQ